MEILSQLKLNVINVNEKFQKQKQNLKAVLGYIEYIIKSDFFSKITFLKKQNRVNFTGGNIC